MADLVKKDNLPGGLTLTGGKLRSSATGFQKRVAQSKQADADAGALPNRIAMMLDKSGSMASDVKGRRAIDRLKDAIESFVSCCNFNDTALALNTFPPGVELQLTTVGIAVCMTAQQLEPSGGTPMHRCVEDALVNVPMTRGIIVSDGGATDWHHGEEGQGYDRRVLDKYVVAGIPIDCVHIGDSTDGEDLLRFIAQITGGLFIKFTDISAFSKAFGYLAPGYRAMLTSGKLTAAELEATEVRR